MADTAPPATSGPPPPTDSKKPKATPVKPEKPDEEQYKADVEKAERAHAKSMDTLNAIKAKLSLAQPHNKDSPTAKRQAELQSKLSEIRKRQSGFKNTRQETMEKVKKLDEQLKSRIAEHKALRSKIPFKSVEEVDQEIDRLERQVASGTMKIVDEKKMLAEISSLNRLKKSFPALDNSQKGIDETKQRISELKKSLDDPEQKALSEEAAGLQSELAQIRKEQDEVFKNLNSLRDERTKAQAEQQETFQALRAVKDAYFQQKRAFRDYEQKAFQQRKERQRAEREAFEANKRKEVAERKLEEASSPAYLDEILTTEGLIRYFDPSALPAKEITATSKFAATAQRTIDDSGLKGTRLAKKEDEDYFAPTGGKKKKGKKGGASAAASETKFNLSIGVIEELAKVKVNAPASQADVPGVVKQLQEKLEFWKEDQDRKTKENIAKAQKEIDRLESEEAGANGNKEAAATNGAAAADKKDEATEVAEKVEEVTLEDKE
ncbi:hypothetical protein EJ06DRAFT_507404 [Trichodelitschia bisporula]|uniref:Nuclear segregation protein n=1 Tax=Trichodelitschia bisporula TaxID=703511 RepID=A0A6G1I305_9PEZI|nr:hypothetical protein EJ06DRAFT_507404 [Trichodelitschia bisporula]